MYSGSTLSYFLLDRFSSPYIPTFDLSEGYTPLVSYCSFYRPHFVVPYHCPHLFTDGQYEEDTSVILPG